jgi:glycosyltransferase involved in cell wall biosynthesis
MTTPLLTIGIPTYNGAHRIGHTLDSVLKQIPQKLLNQVDILVSDNASTDETTAVVQSYQAKHAVRISYSRNEVNLGYDRNVDMLFKKAEGRYVWSLADDDVLKDEAISIVLNLLNQHSELRVILVNFDAYDAQLESIQDQIEIPDNILCRDPESFFARSVSRYSLLSSLILDRSAWNQEDLTKGFGSNFIHVYALFKLLLLGPSYIVGRPLVNYRQGSINFGTSGDAVLAIGLSACKITSQMEEMGHDRKIPKKLLEDSRRYIYCLVRDAKLLGINNKSAAAKALLQIYSNPTVWFKLVPMIYCPNIIYLPLFRLKKKASTIARSLKHKISAAAL